MHLFNGKLFSLTLLIILFIKEGVCNELFPAGKGTTEDFSVHAFSHPMSGTRGNDRRAFVVGNSFFKSAWVSSPASTPLRDGLGPIYNATSCTSCHHLDGRGKGLPNSKGNTDISLLFRIKEINEKGALEKHPVYGDQLQPFGIEDVNGEGNVEVSFKSIEGSYPDGQKYQLSKPIYDFSNLNYGTLSKKTVTSPRVGPQVIGLGLLENIPDAVLLKNEDPLDANKDGISGRANRVVSKLDGSTKIGRFGWKAASATLLEQNAAAFNGDLGITSSVFPEEECTQYQLDCLNSMTVDDLSDSILQRVTEYVQLLGVPKRRNFNDPDVQRGKEIFNKINCQSCHHASYQTGSSSNFDSLNNQKIYPYTDLLLHDMGDLLADDARNLQFEGIATTREWRTPPLWGLGLIETVNGHSRLLHDGRARDFEEAILWHDGEARESKLSFMSLNESDRDRLIKFLKSL